MANLAKLSSTARGVLTLLNNINDLLILSQKRMPAKDVMRALVVYAKHKNFKLPQDKIDTFYEILLDSRINTLSGLIISIAQDIVTEENKSFKKSK